MAKVTMPQLGESVAEGTIGKWLKKPGDHVAKYEPLLEVITDKVNAEVPSPYEGVLREILVEEGETVPNNAEIAIIDEVGADGSAAASAAAPAAQAASPVPVAEAAVVPAEPEPAPTSEPGPAPTPVRAVAPEPEGANGPAGSDERAPHEMPGNPDARMTPAVRRLLREHDLQSAMVVGTGGGGRITREDVTDFVESQRTSKPIGKQDASGASPSRASSATPSAATTAAAGAAPPPQGSTPSTSTSAGPRIVFPAGVTKSSCR